MSPLENLVLKILKRHVPEMTFTARVVSVSKGTNTCIVRQSEDDPDLDQTARLVSVISGDPNPTVLFPVVDSQVTVTVLYNDPSQLQVIGYTQLDEWIMNGGSNGPMIIYSKLLEEYNKTKALLDAIAGALTQWVPVPTDGGTALKTLMTTALEGKASGDFAAEGITNNKMKH